MPDPTIAAKEPAILDLEPGSYYWCACGDSKNQPFCDGAHQGTEFVPVELKIEQARKVALCLCKRTAKPPFCDGAHRKL